jgi:hypothetical protein
MTFGLALLLIATVAATLAAPLLASDTDGSVSSDRAVERLEREKNAALTAIREAQFDHAMGKLSEEDYAALRSFYERRAISALAELGTRPAAPDTRTCDQCGRRFIDDSVYCGGCGRPRTAQAF